MKVFEDHCYRLAGREAGGALIDYLQRTSILKCQGKYDKLIV